METICIRTKIKHNSIKEVRRWFQTLQEKSDEVLVSLKDEGVIIESVFLDEQDSDYYLIYYMKAKDLKHAHEVAIKSTLDIDKYHKKCFKELCEERKVLETLLDFHQGFDVL